MTYYYYDITDGKQKDYKGNPVFVVRLRAEGESRMVYSSADRAERKYREILENLPDNFCMVTYGLETPDGQQLYTKL